MNQNFPRSNSVSLFFQIITLLFTCSFIAFFIYKADKRFCSIDQKPDFFYWIPSNKKSIAPYAIKVNTGLVINDFSEFDVVNNKFTFSGTIWFEFDPTLISLSKIGQFNFERAQIVYKSEKPQTIFKNNKIIAYYEIVVAFKTNLNYKYFPFDDHTLYLVLFNKSVLPGEMIYSTFPENIKTSKDIYFGDWKTYNNRISNGYISTSTDYNPATLHPAVLFEMAYSRTGFRYIIVLFLPLFFIFFIELLSFVVSLRTGSAQLTLLQVSASNIGALFAYRFVIETISPKVGYFLISDYLFFVFLTNSLIIYIINSIGQFLSTFQKELLSIVLQLILGLVILYFLYFLPKC